MSEMKLPEVWLRGPLEHIQPLLQPVAHALLEACEEVRTITEGLDEDLLWERPAGLASPGFHLQHLTGVLDRLITYAKGEQLSQEQLDRMKMEGTVPAEPVSVTALVERFEGQVEKTMLYLRTVPVETLTEARAVGRKQLPSTVIGLIFHAAEHTMRHVGQLLVTTAVLVKGDGPSSE